ncbi:MAG: alpha/beta hydrolase [Isosphaeraceae bacterium]
MSIRWRSFSLRILAWASLLAVLFGAWQRSSIEPRGTDKTAGLTVLKDLPANEATRAPRLDLYLPEGGGPDAPGPQGPALPVIVAIHGGSWTGGSKADYGPLVAPLARHGYAVVVPDYRLARMSEPSWPEALEDLRDTVRWVRRNAAAYGLDPDRVAALGSGAGGHLALLLGTHPPTEHPEGLDARIQAVIDLYGPADLAALGRNRALENDPVYVLARETIPGALRSASPMSHVSVDDPPILILHGLDDRWVPPDQSRALAARFAGAGVNHRLLLLPGARHGFGLNLGGPEPRDLTPAVLEFLEIVWQARERSPTRDNSVQAQGPASSAAK